jgi:hypothetical protein
MTDDKVGCTFCEGGKRVISLTESNELFLSRRISDGNIDEAITIARIAWDKFPELKESADTKRVVETLLEGIVQKIQSQVFTPIGILISGMNGLKSTLEKNPDLIQKCSDDTIQRLNERLSLIASSIEGPMSQMNGMLTQYFNKPSVKGSVGEKMLADIWQGKFERDSIVELSGAGRGDLLVTPYLNTGVSRPGDRISVERKSGKQKYTPDHLDQAVRHSIDRGATYSIIVYDTQDNLPQAMKTMITREKDVLVAIVDIESGTWKMARDIFGILQCEMLLQKKKINEINVQSIQQVATEIRKLKEVTSDIRGKTAKFQREIDSDCDEIDAYVKSFHDRLTAAVSGTENGGVEKLVSHN